ncbi:hypothetical protein Tco_0969849 [Tanacetum coccineum]
MLVPGNYIQWKSQIKRYIGTKPNNELIHYCLQNPPYKFKWTEKTVPVTEGSSKTTIEGYMENFKNVLQDIRNQLDAEAEAVQIILTWIDNDIYSTIDACPNACEMWKAIERLKQGESINVQDLETNLYWEFGKFTLWDGESLELYYSRFVMLVKQSQELKTVSYHKLYDILKQQQNEVNEIRAERLARSANPLALVHRWCSSLGFSVIICKEYGHVAREYQKPKREKDAAYHKEKMLLCKQDKVRIQLSVEQVDWRDDTDDKPDNQELEAYYMYMAHIQEVIQYNADNSRPLFDAELLQKVQNDDDNYNVFANDKEHPDNNRGEADHDEDEDLASKRILLASLIDKLKCEIDDNKNRNKIFESSNKTLVDKLIEIDCAKAKGYLKSYKMESQKSFNEYTRKINDLNQTISEMKKELFAHQETISIISQENEAQNKFHKTREDRELEKIIALENKIKVLDDIVYKTGQSVQTMNMFNRNCITSFGKPEFLKKA